MRNITGAFRAILEQSNSSEVIVIFATITHPSLLQTLYFNSDIIDYSYQSNIYKGVAFSLSLLTDDQNMPARAQVSIQNVDQAIGAAVQALASPPTIGIQIFIKSDFDNGNPRLPISTPGVEFSAQGLKLQNVKADAMTMSADLVGMDLTAEPWPAIRSTQKRLPGLYR